jgi:integrase
MMTIEQAVQKIQAVSSSYKSEPVPNNLLADLCNAMWDAGQHPQINTILSCLPHLDKRAIQRGFHAWRASKGFRLQYPRWANPNFAGPEALAKSVSPEVARAPFTWLDPANDGRWPGLHPRLVGYLIRIENPSLRDVMVLYSLIKATYGEQALYCRLSTCAAPLRKLMQEQRIERVQDINPDDLLFRVSEGKAGKDLTPTQRSALLLGWNTLTNTFLEYAERLDKKQRQAISGFFLRPLRNRYRMHQKRPSILIRDQRHQKVKAKTDIIHSQFHKLRFLAKVRCNQASRLHTAVKAAIRFAVEEKHPLPHEFNYEETVATESGRPVHQRVLLTLWDNSSLFDHARSLGFTRNLVKAERRRKRRTGRFAPRNPRYHIQYRGVEPLGEASRTEPFWFLDLFENRVFACHLTPETEKKRAGFLKGHGYTSRLPWEFLPGLLKPIRRHTSAETQFLERDHGYRFLHYEGIYATSLFGHLVVRMQTTTGARIGEVQQISQNPECIKQLVNVGPKAATRWLLRMFPKGRRERGDFFIDNDTKDLLLEVLRLHREVSNSKKLPVIPTQSSRHPADRYILQWDGRALDQSHLNTAIRFLLYNAVLDANGACVDITSHLLRHSFATEMAGLNVPVDVIAQILHHRNLETTRYYSKPTKQQVMQAAELLFVDRIDIAAESLRHPNEIGRMLREAEGQIGALTEVVGGTCVIGNMCPAKFACVGCSGNAPDPDRRSQIEAKRDWALVQITWAAKESLPAEQRQMKRLVADCDQVLEEMTLIERARADSSQGVTVEQEKTHASTEAYRTKPKMVAPAMGPKATGNRKASYRRGSPPRRKR